MRKSPLPLADRLRDVVLYDATTGVFRWKNPAGKRASFLRGKIAGCKNAYGYRVIRVDGVLFQASRLAWLYTHGVPPHEEIDHINGDVSDNRLSNLREATRVQNGTNQGPNCRSLSGIRGVRWHSGDRRWQARYKGKWLGNFLSKEDAALAYVKHVSAIHGEFVRKPCL